MLVKDPTILTSQVWNDNTIPMVSISCRTYNHENFIREAIEGFLMQKTTFRVEILIHDDASTDRTSEIVREYENKYPQLFKCFYQHINTYSLEDKAEKIRLTRPFKEARRGKYIALCEGDDYWTDPLKLQKQVEFLEGHPDYILSFHDCSIVDELGTYINESKLGSHRKRDYSNEDLVCGMLVPTLSVVYRSGYLKKIPKKPDHVINGDTFLFSNLGKFGKGHFHHDIKPAIYRSHPGGIWSSRESLSKYKHLLNTYSALLKAHYPNHQILLKNKIFRVSLSMLMVQPSFKEKIKHYPAVITRLPINMQFIRNFILIHYYLFFK